MKARKNLKIRRRRHHMTRCYDMNKRTGEIGGTECYKKKEGYCHYQKSHRKIKFLFYLIRINIQKAQLNPGRAVVRFGLIDRNLS